MPAPEDEKKEPEALEKVAEEVEFEEIEEIHPDAQEMINLVEAARAEGRPDADIILDLIAQQNLYNPDELEYLNKEGKKQTMTLDQFKELSENSGGVTFTQMLDDLVDQLKEIKPEAVKEEAGEIEIEPIVTEDEENKGNSAPAETAEAEQANYTPPAMQLSAGEPQAENPATPETPKEEPAPEMTSADFDQLREDVGNLTISDLGIALDIDNPTQLQTTVDDLRAAVGLNRAAVIARVGQLLPVEMVDDMEGELTETQARVILQTVATIVEEAATETLKAQAIEQAGRQIIEDINNLTPDDLGNPNKTLLKRMMSHLSILVDKNNPAASNPVLAFKYFPTELVDRLNNHFDDHNPDIILDAEASATALLQQILDNLPTLDVPNDLMEIITNIDSLENYSDKIRPLNDELKGHRNGYFAVYTERSKVGRFDNLTGIKTGGVIERTLGEIPFLAGYKKELDTFAGDKNVDITGKNAGEAGNTVEEDFLLGREGYYTARKKYFAEAIKLFEEMITEAYGLEASSTELAEIREALRIGLLTGYLPNGTKMPEAIHCLSDEDEKKRQHEQDNIYNTPLNKLGKRAGELSGKITKGVFDFTLKQINRFRSTPSNYDETIAKVVAGAPNRALVTALFTLFGPANALHWLVRLALTTTVLGAKDLGYTALTKNEDSMFEPEPGDSNFKKVRYKIGRTLEVVAKKYKTTTENPIAAAEAKRKAVIDKLKTINPGEESTKLAPILAELIDAEQELRKKKRNKAAADFGVNVVVGWGANQGADWAFDGDSAEAKAGEEEKMAGLDKNGNATNTSSQEEKMAGLDKNENTGQEQGQTESETAPTEQEQVKSMEVQEEVDYNDFKRFDSTNEVWVTWDNLDQMSPAQRMTFLKEFMNENFGGPETEKLLNQRAFDVLGIKDSSPEYFERYIKETNQWEALEFLREKIGGYSAGSEEFQAHEQEIKQLHQDIESIKDRFPRGDETLEEFEPKDDYTKKIIDEPTQAQKGYSRMMFKEWLDGVCDNENMQWNDEITDWEEYTEDLKETLEAAQERLTIALESESMATSLSIEQMNELGLITEDTDAILNMSVANTIDTYKQLSLGVGDFSLEGDHTNLAIKFMVEGQIGLEKAEELLANGFDPSRSMRELAEELNYQAAYAMVSGDETMTQPNEFYEFTDQDYATIGNWYQESLILDLASYLEEDDYNRIFGTFEADGRNVLQVIGQDLEAGSAQDWVAKYEEIGKPTPLDELNQAGNEALRKFIDALGGKEQFIEIAKKINPSDPYNVPFASVADRLSDQHIEALVQGNQS